MSVNLFKGVFVCVRARAYMCVLTLDVSNGEKEVAKLNLLVLNKSTRDIFAYYL